MADDNIVDFDVTANDNQGVWQVDFTVTATWSHPIIIDTPEWIVDFQVSGSWKAGWIIPTATATWQADFEIFVDWASELDKRNVIQWAGINKVDFTIGRDNVAGEEIMDWKGWVYAILKLRNEFVVYGQNGISVRTPKGNAWGHRTIYRLGLLGKQAVCGDESNHWAIDSEGQLVQIGEGLERLDYSEYLSLLTNPVMSYDVESGNIYIADGTYGYVYSTRDRSLGTGPINITGIGSQSGTLYPVASGAIVTPPLEICTDIYDFGTRRGKNIESIEFGIDQPANSTKTLSVRVDYRMDKTRDFDTTSWDRVDPRGMVFPGVFGKEFRIRMKDSLYEYEELDYIKVNGSIHAY